jgi:chitin synthase
MLTTYPIAQTRQALRARAFTDVPHSWSVYLSQRRRWTLGATSNDLLLFTARHCQWWERILAFSNVLCWSLNIFIVAAIGCMIVAFMSQPWWIIMAFAGVMIIPLTYYIIIAFWLPRTWKDSMQYLVGLFIFVVCGPLMNITVMLFAVYNMDSFGWGKTRLVVSDEAKAEAEAEKSENNNNGNGRGLPVQREKPAGTGSGYDEEAMVGMTVGRPGAAHLAPTKS